MEENSNKKARKNLRLLAIITVTLILVVAAVGITYSAFRTTVTGELTMPKAGTLRAKMSLIPNETLALAWDNDSEDVKPEGYEIKWVDETEGNNNQNWLADLGPGESAETYANYAKALVTDTASTLTEEELAALSELVNNRRMILSVESNAGETVSDTGIVYNLRIYSTGMLPLEFVLMDNNAKEDNKNTYPLYYSKCTKVEDTGLKAKGWYYLYEFYTESGNGLGSAEAEFQQLLEWNDAGRSEKDPGKNYEIFVGWDDDMENAQDSSLRKETERLKVVVHLVNDPDELHGNPTVTPTVSPTPTPTGD